MQHKCWKDVGLLESVTMNMVIELPAHSVYHQKYKNIVMDMTAVHRRLLQDPAGWFVCASVLLLLTWCSSTACDATETDKSEYIHWCIQP